MTYLLIQQCPETGACFTVNSAAGQVGREALQEQADRMSPRGTVITEGK